MRAVKRRDSRKQVTTATLTFLCKGGLVLPPGHHHLLLLGAHYPHLLLPPRLVDGVPVVLLRVEAGVKRVESVHALVGAIGPLGTPFPRSPSQLCDDPRHPPLL